MVVRLVMAVASVLTLAAAASGSCLPGRSCLRDEQYEINATIDFDSDVLNPESCGPWATCYIELAAGHDPEYIVMATVVINGMVHAEVSPTSIGDYDEDGIADRMVKFSRAEVVAALGSGEDVDVEVTGQVDDVLFRGSDVMSVLVPTVTYPNGGEVLLTGEEYVIAWERPFGQDEDCYDVYYSGDDGATWETVESGIDSTTYAWTVPDEVSRSGRIMVVNCEGSDGTDCDECDYVFSIVAGGVATAYATDSEKLKIAIINDGGSPVIQFVLPNGGEVLLTLHDVVGRLVKTLLGGRLSPGCHAVTWDGTDESGDRMSPGIYFARVEAGTGRATGKAILVR